MLRNRNTVQNTLGYLYSPNAASRRFAILRGLHCGSPKRPLEIDVYQGALTTQHSTTYNTQYIKQSHVTLSFGRPLAHLCTARSDVNQSAPVVSSVRPISTRRLCRSCLDTLPLPDIRFRSALRQIQTHERHDKTASFMGL